MKFKMTKKREQLLNLLQQGKALSASQVHAALPEIDLVTVYRNLDLFTQEGIVKKFTFGEEALYELQKHPHHHAICSVCNKVIHFDIEEKQLAKLITLKNFAASSIDVTVSGVCCKG